MWDKPAVLNGIANALFAAAVLLIAYATLHYAVRLPAFPLREVRITHALAHVTPAQIESIVAREVNGNLIPVVGVARGAVQENDGHARGRNIRRSPLPRRARTTGA